MTRTLLVGFLGLAVAATASAADWVHGELPDGPVAVRGGITPISSVNANTGSGFSQLEFQTVTVEGVAQLRTGVLDPLDLAQASTWIYVVDATGGVAVVNPTGVPTTVTEGDAVRVTGAVITKGDAGIQGTRTLDLATLGAGSITVIGTGSVNPPMLITAAELVSNGAAHEGSRVRVDSLSVLPGSSWPAAGSSGFVVVTDGADTIRVFIDDDTDLDGVPPPAVFDVTGFVAQDDAAPWNDNHFLWPALPEDIYAGDGSGLVTVSPPGAPQNAIDVSLGFTVTGQQATLGTVEIDIPVDWGWTGLAGDVELSGPGVASASVSVPSGGAPFTVRVTNAAVTGTEPGTITVSSLTAPMIVGSYVFEMRTATPTGTPSRVPGSPVVEVVPDVAPGGIVINELHPVTSGGSTREEAEFVELANRTGADVDISRWTLADIGRGDGCTLDRRWAFPDGTILPASGFVVVCRTALDDNNTPGTDDDEGFLVNFPPLPPGVELYEMFDATGEIARMDHSTPDMILLDDTPEDDQIALLGGATTNGGQCESPDIPGRFVPYAEMVVLRDVLGRAIDAMEYREIGPCQGDLCVGPYTGPDDAYPYGAPKPGHSLGRDAVSTDTDASRDDILPASVATPGAPNVPGDTVPPAIVLGEDPGISASVLEIRYDEAVDQASALDPAHYRVTGPSGENFVVREILPDSEEPQRHYFVIMDPMPAGVGGTLYVSGVTDLLISGTGGNVLDGSVGFTIPTEAMTVCEIQEFDSNGFSPHQGETVVVAGFVTVGDIGPVAVGELPAATRVSIWVQEPNGCGVNVFAFLPEDGAEFAVEFPDVREYGIRLNDFVVVRGTVTEFVSSSSGSGAVTELAGIGGDRDFYRFLTRGADGPEPIEVSTVEANDESLEGTLVHTVGTVINGNDIAAYIDDGSGTIQVFQNFSSLDLTRFIVGDRLDVTGIITQFDSSPPYFSGYELVPQNQDAIFKVDGGFATSGPAVRVEQKILLPHLGERIRIFTRSPGRSDMIVEIYDAVGRKITTLYDGVGLGEMRFEWDGRGQDGAIVDPGVYVCHARAVALDGGNTERAAAPIVVGLRLDGPGNAGLAR